MGEKIIEESKHTFLNLECTKDKSIFKLTKTKEANGMPFLAMMLGYRGDVYSDLKKQKTYTILKNENNLIIENDLKIWTWEIINESKKIHEYVCYKAIGSKEITNRKKEKITSSVEVWYCPEFNYSFGPFDYNGLPGLIFEVNLINSKYALTKININQPKKEINIPDGKIINNEDYLGKIKTE